MAAKNLTILFFYSSSIGENHQGRLYQKNNSFAPLVHNLAKLAETSEILLTPKQKSQLNEATEFNASGRYEDYKFKLYKRPRLNLLKMASKAKLLLAYFQKEL